MDDLVVGWSCPFYIVVEVNKVAGYKFSGPLCNYTKKKTKQNKTAEQIISLLRVSDSKSRYEASASPYCSPDQDSVK